MPLAQFAQLKGDAENDSGSALEAMEPLQEAAATGLGIIVVRHERKSGGEVGDAGRGSSAFGGAVDVVVSLRRPEGKSRRTIRAIQALSRFSETPGELMIELTPGGYVSLGSSHDVALGEAKEAILAAAPRSEGEAKELKVITLPADVKRATAQRAIQQLLACGHLARTGNGRRGSPFRYWKPEKATAQTSIPNGQKGNETYPG